MKTRKDFGLFLTERGLLDSGVEVGVAAGNFARTILQKWKGARLYLVDPYEFQNRWLDRSDSQEAHNFHLACVRDLTRLDKRANLIRTYSVNAARLFKKEQLDFVYLDACHDYRSVKADLEAWWPLIKKGGIMAGHDYKNSFVRRNLVEVRRAVDDFFYLQSRAVSVTTDDNIPSWFIEK